MPIIMQPYQCSSIVFFIVLRVVDVIYSSRHPQPFSLLRVASSFILHLGHLWLRSAQFLCDFIKLFIVNQCLPRLINLIDFLGTQFLHLFDTLHSLYCYFPSFSHYLWRCIGCYPCFQLHELFVDVLYYFSKFKDLGF